MSSSSETSVGFHPSRPVVSELEVGLSVPMNEARKLNRFRTCSGDAAATGSARCRPIAEAISRNGTLVGDAVVAGAGLPILKGLHEQPRRVQTMHRWPPVAALAGVAGHAVLAGVADDLRQEAVVAVAVDEGRQPHQAGPHTAPRKVGDRLFSGAARPANRGRIDVQVLRATLPAGNARVPKVDTNGRPGPSAWPMVVMAVRSVATAAAKNLGTTRRGLPPSTTLSRVAKAACEN